MMRLVFAGDVYSHLHRALMHSADETCALLLASPPASDRGRPSILVREFHPVPEHAYEVRSATQAQIKPEFLVPLVQRARNENLSVVFAHTHPNARGTPEFSLVDDDGETYLIDFLKRRIPDTPHVALVLGKNGCAARMLGEKEPVEVVQVGAQVQRLFSPEEPGIVDSRWDRQVRAFGSDGQSIIQNLRVAIVGTGGTGSVVAEQLALLGVRHFTLVDPDIVDHTNLNRLVGTRPTDVGKEKVSVVAKFIQAVNTSAVVDQIVGDVTYIETAKRLLDSDAIFACTDSHASRAILNQLAYQYYIPVFDVGVGIVASKGKVTHITGRVQMASPGVACLVCAGVLDGAAVRRELQTESERAADPYITGHHEPQPAVISLNSTMSSLAVTMFLNTFTSIPGEARIQYYNGMTGTVRPAHLRPDPSCIVCSKSGSLGCGDAWPLAGRQSVK